MKTKISLYLLIALFLSGCIQKQRLVVIPENSGFAKAKVYFFEGDKLINSYDATIGRNGVAAKNQKKEGDGKTPSGIYGITAIFGKSEPSGINMPFIKTDSSLRCVDDPKSSHYNLIIDSSKVVADYASSEEMLREDGLYDIGAVIDYNSEGKKNAGSCIFMHIANKEGKPTAGCVAFKEEDMKQIASLLSKDKEPTIEIKE